MTNVLKIDRKDWNEFKKKKDGIPIINRLNAWVEHFGKSGFTSIEFLGKEGDMFKIGSSAKMMKVSLDGDIAHYNLIVPDEEWLNFKNICRDNGMSANYALGCMIREYNQFGGFVTKEILF